MHRRLIIAFAAMAIALPAAAASAQQDTTHQGMPGMKMPAPTKPTTKAKPKPKAAPKAGARTTAKAKTARRAATPKKPRPQPTAAKPQHPDTAHVAMPADSAHAGHNPVQMQMRDTSHMQMRDTSHMQMRDTSHMQMRDTSHMQMPGMQAQHTDTMAMQMSMDGPLGVSMERMGSGTTWIPDAVMLPSRHAMVGRWAVMLHGFAFVQYDHQAGQRGDDQFGSLNWAMIMASRSVGAGHLQFRFMPSLDAATVGKCGYPLLLQSGETCNGQPLVDRQHPHDFFMELGALYERPLTSKLAMLLYIAPAGEPALGPVAFMHRPSAMDIPFAPLGHHWQDATHISFGVLTGGLYTRTVRLEASAFNGIEPGENRWDFDPIKINSYSTRVTIDPDSSWSVTAGYGMIAEPEVGDPNGKLHRLVGSAMHGKRLGPDAQWATTLIVGANKAHDWSSSGLIESEAVLDRHNTLFARAELVQKNAAELAVTSLPADRLFNVGSASVGYIRELVRGRGATIGIGGSGTLNFVPTTLEPSYGSKTPVGAMIFLRLRPYHSPHSAMQMNGGMSHGPHRQ